MPPAPSQFGETRWSLVIAAQGNEDPQPALAELCRIYWYPLYAFVRRSGHTREEAEDLTQEFFARLLSKQWLTGVDRAKGRFRSFLLATMKHFLANEWRRTQAEKRGGKSQSVPLDVADAEQRYFHEPADSMTPELLFERRWALTILDNVFAALREEMAQAGKQDVFQVLKDLLTPDAHRLSYAEAGTRLGMTEDAVKMAVYRLRKRYRDLLRAHIAATVSVNAEIDLEIRDLFRVLAVPK